MKHDKPQGAPDEDYFINQMIREYMMKRLEKSGKMEAMKKKVKKIMASSSMKIEGDDAKD